VLSPQQLYFIAASLVHPNDDIAAAEASNVEMTLVETWKLDPEFLTALDRAYNDNIDLAKERIKTLLVKATNRLDEALDAEKKGKYGLEPDHVARLKAIELSLKANGLLNDPKVGVNVDSRQIVLDLGMDLDLDRA